MVLYLTLFFGCLAIICSLCVITVKNPVHAILYLILVFCNISFILIIWNVEFVAVIFLIVYVGAIAVLFLFVVMMLNIKIIELNEVFWRYLPIGLLISSIFILEIFYLLSNQHFFLFSYINLLFNLLFSTKQCSFSSFILLSDNMVPNLNLTLNIKPSLFLQHTYGDSYLFNFVGFTLYEHNLVFNDFTYWLLNNESKNNTEILGWFLYTYGFFLFFVISLILLLAMIGSIVLILNQNINVKRQLIFQQVSRNFSNSIRLVH